MKKPDYLCRFPCMDPWIGPKYGCDGKRLAIVAESHYLPPGVTRLNYDPPEKWYAATQESVPDERGAHLWMNTRKCVERRYESCNPTYLTIDKVVSFEEIAFFNYVFRPAEGIEENSENQIERYSGNGNGSGTQEERRFKICDKDREISSEIMEWFIRKHQPTAIVIASATVMQYTCVRCDLAAHPEIKICITDHPTASLAKPSNTEPSKKTESPGNPEPFVTDVREFLKNPSYRGSQAGLPFSLNEAQRACCRSHPRRSGKPAS